MTPTMKSLGIDRLTREQRVALAAEIMDSVLLEGPLPLSEAKQAELERRWQESEDHPEEGIPGDEVIAEIERRLKK